MSFRCFLAGFGLLLLQGVSQAATLEQGVSSYRDGNYRQAYRMMEPLAEKGDSEAQFYIGGMLLDGLGVKADPQKGVYWLEKAVRNKNRDAAMALGKMYLSGYRVPMDASRASHYLQVAEDLRSGEEDASDCD